MNAATPTGLKLSPASASIPVSGTLQYTALEIFSDGTSIDRTKSPTTIWSSSTANATLSPSGASAGLATGAAVGTSTITATYGVGGPSATANLTVNAATPTGLKLTPASASIPVSGTLQYTALEIFSDGTSIDRTTSPTTIWSSSTANATLSPSGATAGLATGAAVGTSNITATYGVGGPSATVTLTVTAPNPGPAGSVNLLSVAPFGIIGFNAITNSAGASHIYGDVALTQPGPGGTIASVTGPGTNDSGTAPLLASSIVTTSLGVNPGVITAANNGTPTNIAALPQLLADLGTVYADLNTRAPGSASLTTPASVAAATIAGTGGGTFPAAAPDLSGYVLSPGIYTTTGTYGLSNTLGPLVLDAGGNPNAVFIIRSTGLGISGITSTTGSVVLQNGATSKNVFWVVDNATIGGGTFFQGTVVAGHAITLNSYANVEGRMLAGALGLVSGAITLTGTNIITVPQ